MMIVDAHRDIAYDHIELERDYGRSVAETRAWEAEHPREGRGEPALTGLPDAIDAGVALVNAVIFTEPATFEAWGSAPLNAASKIVYNTPQEAEQAAMLQLEWYKSFASRQQNVQMVYTAQDLDDVLATWKPAAEPAARKQGFILLMEGADPLVEPSDFGKWWEYGVRILGTSWSRTRYAGGTRAPGPLTVLGRALLNEMAPYNALLDLSHMAEESALEALGSYAGPIFASHANPRHFSNTDRHLSDETIKLLAERDGVMGFVMINMFWAHPDEPSTTIPLSRVLDAVDYVCQLTGSARHVGLGTDWYAGMSNADAPDELDSVADLPKIAAGLAARGYAPSDIEAIMGGNMLRKIREALPSL
jgi:membrane dipeptidase